MKIKSSFSQKPLGHFQPNGVYYPYETVKGKIISTLLFICPHYESRIQPLDNGILGAIFLVVQVLVVHVQCMLEIYTGGNLK